MEQRKINDEFIQDLANRCNKYKQNLLKKKLIDRNGKKLKPWLYVLDPQNWGISIKVSKRKKKRGRSKDKNVNEFYQPDRKRVKFDDVDNNVNDKRMESSEIIDNFENALDSGSFNDFWNVVANQQFFDSVLQNAQSDQQYNKKRVESDKCGDTQKKSGASDLVEKIRKIRNMDGHKIPKPKEKINNIRIDVKSIIQNQNNRGIDCVARDPVLGLDIKDKQCVVIRVNEIASRKDLTKQQTHLSKLLNSYSNDDIARALKG